VKLIESFLAAGKPIALVCHAPAAPPRQDASWQAAGRGKKVAGFANTEEAFMG
jgi:putative intracellular protease/amidase